MNTLKFSLRVFVEGCHSNIPLCCVLFYIYLTLRYPTEAWAAFVADRRGVTLAESAPYVRCNWCHKHDRRFILHLCTKECSWMERFGSTWYYSEADLKYLRSLGRAY